MEINRNNYEAYFIDYLEGNLDKRLVNSFIEFIKLNPDLKKELDLFESVSAIPEDISFNKKEALYKEKYDLEKEFDEAAIATLEGDISKKEKFEFNVYLAEHPEKKKEADLFTQTKLVADPSITFEKKNKLYRKSNRKIILWWSGRVAAILILAFTVFSLLDKTSNEIPIEKQLVQIDDKPIQKEKTFVAKIRKEQNEQKINEPIEKKLLNLEPEVKKVVPINKRNNTIQEPAKDNFENEHLALARTPIEIPLEMQAITASIETHRPKATMAIMYLSYPDEYYDDEWLLAEKVKDKFNLSKITKAGLNLVTSISNNNFSYQTNNEGKVTEYKYDSRLLAFSLPGRRVQPE